MSEQLKPLSLIYNKKSGFHAANKDEVYEQLVADLSTAGFEVQSFELSECINFDQMMQDILLRHRQAENVGVVVAAGGDGTLNAVASKLMERIFLWGSCL